MGDLRGGGGSSPGRAVKRVDICREIAGDHVLRTLAEGVSWPEASVKSVLRTTPTDISRRAAA
jgi:hypothetical protein